MGSRIYAGDLELWPGADGSWKSQYNLTYGLRLGVIGIFGVLIAKIWLRKASKEFFSFLYERVTYVMTFLSGMLLVTGVKLNDVILAAGEALFGAVQKAKGA